MKQKTIRIATRKSQLALWQANHIKQKLEQAHPELRVEIVPLITAGDRLLTAKLADFGGKGLFVKELEQALLSNEADIAVHSMKDVPTHFPDGLKLATICEREDPRDVLAAKNYPSLSSLPKNARVGTSSLRRQCQLRRYRHDIQLIELRGNVDTRLRKLDEGEFDAVILAAAGLKRLGFEDQIKEFLPEKSFIPAVGQGALGIECRDQDEFIMTLIEPLNHPQTAACVTAERAMTNYLNGGCHAPIAAHAAFENARIVLTGMVASITSGEYIEDSVCGLDPTLIGTELAEKLVAKGALELLSACSKSR